MQKFRPNFNDPMGSYIEDSSGKTMIGWGDTVPADATAGFRPGCIFMQTDGAAGSQLYINEGTVTSCDFNQLVLLETRTEVVTTTNSILAAENGKTFYLNAAAGFASTLPAPAAGLRFRFVVQTAPTGGTGYTVLTASSANIFVGSIGISTIDDTVDGSSDGDGDTITFVNDAAVAGDWVDVESDGTSWFVRGHGLLATGITITKAT